MPGSEEGLEDLTNQERFNSDDCLTDPTVAAQKLVDSTLSVASS